MKTTVFHHSADWDGLFCREIARKFLPGAELIGWDFGDAPMPIPDGQIYVMDLPVDRLFGFTYKPEDVNGNPPQHPAGLVWIDHHKSSIETHPKDIPGYRIDGVAACRLAWQYFRRVQTGFSLLPTDVQFKNREVSEPLAVRLAGEYDIWDKRDPDAELFQHGLRSQELGEDEWKLLLSNPATHLTEYDIVDKLLRQAKTLQFARANEYRDVITQQGFDVEFEGVKFLACNSHELDIRSHLFEAGIKPHHEALLGFTFTGHDWRVSMYRIEGKPADILKIAKQYGGGGHAGACGFRAQELASILGSAHF